MKFLVDAQLPGTLARWLRRRDCDAVHLLDCGMAQADDRTIWKKAIEEERIVISKDEDFFILATRIGDNGRLLWLRMGNCRTTDLLTRLNRDWSAVVTAFSEGQQVVEMR